MPGDRDKTVGLVYSDRYLQHNPGTLAVWQDESPFPFVDPLVHLSNHRLVMNTKHLLDLTGVSSRLTELRPAAASPEELAAFHEPEYIGHVQAVCAAGGGELGHQTPAGRDSYEIARLAAGGAMTAVDVVSRGEVRTAYALVRPPGHHAEAGQARGFCIFNNIVIAAKHAQRRHGLERVLIVDWDVHWGNGTQHAFYADPSVLFVSVHQEYFGSGPVDQSGEGAGTGYNVNVPLPGGSGDAAYLAVVDAIIEPLAREFKPDLVMISAGQDANAMDSLGRMSVTSRGYRQLTAALVEIAELHAGGRLVLVQEGGYSDYYAPYCTFAIIDTLAGGDTVVPEPITADDYESMPECREVGLDATAAIQRARSSAGRYWASLAGSA